MKQLLRGWLFRVKKKIDHEFWEKYFKVYDVLNIVIPYQELLDTIIEKLDIQKDDLVLDAGCGTGNLAIKMESCGANVIGIDYCAAALERYKSKNPEAEAIIHDLTMPLPFPDNYFDKIASNNVIYTLKKEMRNAVFDEFYRVLKPNGKIVVSNARKGGKPVMIYYDTVKKLKQRTGILKTTAVIFKMLIPTAKILIYNKQLDKEDNNGSVDFVEENEQFELLRNSGFRHVAENIIVYSEQSILNFCLK